jgi:hypothetical protein
MDGFFARWKTTAVLEHWWNERDLGVQNENFQNRVFGTPPFLPTSQQLTLGLA